RRLRGVVHDAAAQEAVSRGGTTLGEILDKPAIVAPDTLLADVFAPAAESPLPVAVVDPDDHLLGVIPRATLLSAMASISAANGAATDDGAAAGDGDATDDDADEVGGTGATHTGRGRGHNGAVAGAPRAAAS